ncbi:transposase [Sporosarcina globispora]|uniref:Transposase n=1 Tax=Sporosarcina globispora TaxID=1459 RepID=A0A0M0GHI6_SPOGL|nr:helix-turn-helix domain-containing protein [Sporosarcina globispora]KON88901.1 transposase [Sporosarcina globispora]
MAKKGQKFINYSFEFKLSAVIKYFEGEMGYKAIAKMLGLPDHTYIRRWVKNYKELGEEGLKDRRGKSESPIKGRPRTIPMSIEEENKILKMENEFLKKLRAFQRR